LTFFVHSGKMCRFLYVGRPTPVPSGHIIMCRAYVHILWSLCNKTSATAWIADPDVARVQQSISMGVSRPCLIQSRCFLW